MAGPFFGVGGILDSRIPWLNRVSVFEPQEPSVSLRYERHMSCGNISSKLKDMDPR